MTAIAPTESRVLSGLPIPDAVHYPDTGFRRDTYAVRLFEAHGYDTGGQPYYSAETVRALLAQQAAAPQVAAWRWPGGHWQDGEPTEQDEADMSRVGAKPEFAYSAPTAAPQVPSLEWLHAEYERWLAKDDAGGFIEHLYDAMKALPNAAPQVPEGWRGVVDDGMVQRALDSWFDLPDYWGEPWERERMKNALAAALATPPAPEQPKPAGDAMPRPLRDLLAHTEHVIEAAGEGVDFAVSRSWLEAMATMGLLTKGGRSTWCVTDAAEQVVSFLSAKPAGDAEAVPSLSDADIAAWVERHDLGSSLSSASDARSAFEDAQTAHLLPEARRLAAQPAQGEGEA